MTQELIDEIWIVREKLTERERIATGAFAPMDVTWDQYWMGNLGGAKSPSTAG